MPGIGVVVNIVTVLVGTAAGLLFGRFIAQRFRRIAFVAIGLATTVIGAAMAIGGLRDLGDTAIGDYAALVLVGSLALGGIVGEAARIEFRLERFGHWLQELATRVPILAPGRASEPGEKGHNLVEGFVTASLLFCVGAMTILGSIQDGLGDPSLLYLKALLDGIAALALATTLGVGVGLSVIPIALVQGGLALGAHSIQAYVTDPVVFAIELIGGALILAIGFDLSGIKRLPVGNLLPAILIGALVAALLT